jgi:hypothetical protein
MNNPLVAVDEIVNAKVKSMIDSGSIAEMIEAKIESTISEVVESELRSYSDFGKGLKSYINKSLQVDFDSLGFEGYHENLLRVISKVYKNSVESEHLEKVKKITEEMLANPPELVTLSSLIEAVKEKARSSASETEEAEYEPYTHEDEITCIIRDMNDKFFTYIHLDARSGVSSHSCAYQIGISKLSDEVRIMSFRTEGKDTNDMFITETYGLERLLFKAKCASSAFEFDVDVESLDLHYSVEIEPECHC